MQKENSDVLGKAIAHYWQHGNAAKINILINGKPDEPLDPAYFFRHFNKMPFLEQYALSMAEGKCLDVGAAAGCHSLILQEWGLDVTALELSPISCRVAKERGVNQVICADLMHYEETGFDTILLLMNGWGIGATVDGTSKLIQKLKTMLNPGGKIIGDTSDLIYFQPANHSHTDLLDSTYYGQIQFDIEWNKYHQKFPWIYPAPQLLEQIAQQHGMDYELILEGEHFDFLVALSKPY